MPSKKINTITLTLKGGGLHPDYDTKLYFEGKKRSLKEGQSVVFKEIKPAQARSIAQHNRHWGIVLPMYGQYINSVSDMVKQDKNGKLVYTVLHSYLLTRFAIENRKPEMFEYKTVYENGDYREVAIASESFLKMPQKIMQEFTQWLEDHFHSAVGKTIDQIRVEETQ